MSHAIFGDVYRMYFHTVWTLHDSVRQSDLCGTTAESCTPQQKCVSARLFISLIAVYKYGLLWNLLRVGVVLADARTAVRERVPALPICTHFM